MSFFNERKAEQIRPPTVEDWKNAEIFIEFLKIFNDVTVDFSASLSVTSNLYFHHLCTIQTQLHLCIENEDVLLSKMAEKMYSVVNKYISSMYSIIRTQTEDPSRSKSIQSVWISSVYKKFMSISVWEYFKLISLDRFDNMSQTDPNQICPPLIALLKSAVSLIFKFFNFVEVGHCLVEVGHKLYI